MRTVLMVVFITTTILLPPPQAQAACGHPVGRPSVGLVLSGGGARGAAHVGVIQVLEELQIPVDCIAGTSMGAIVGGLYASGMTSDELNKTLKQMDWADALQDSPARQDLPFRRKQDDTNFLIDFDVGFHNGDIRLPKGLVQGQKLNLILRKLTSPVLGIQEFDNLPIPFRAVATDAESGAMIVLGKGDLVSAMKASMSAPGVFAPVEIDGRILMDGGVANNLPVDVAKAMGADVLIVVDIGFPLLPRDQLNSAINLTNQMLTIMIKRKTDEQLGMLTGRDIAILPQLGDIGSTDFHRTIEMAPLGAKATRLETARLSKLSITSLDYNSYQQAKRAMRQSSTRVVKNIILDDQSRWSDKVLQANIESSTGKTLELATLESDITRLYGLDSFEQVDYEIKNINDQENEVLIKTREKSWGPNFVNLGITLEDDFEGSSGYNLALRYTKTQVNPLGAEWRMDFQVGDNPLFTTEFYQPLNYASRYFVAPRISLEKRPVSLFDNDGSRLAEFRLSSGIGSLDFGRTIGQSSEIRAGVNRGKERASLRIGDPATGNSDFEVGAWRVLYRYDSRDNVRFPRNGAIGGLQWEGFRESLGDEFDNDKLTFSWFSANSFNKHTLAWSVFAGSNLNSDGQIEDLYDLGGLLNLSGYRNGELRGQHAFVSSLAYYRYVGLGSSTFPTPLYFGASLEAGNVWNDSDDIEFSSLRGAGSVFVGLDTFIGPLYLAYGMAEGGRTATYFLLGQTFGQTFAP